MAVFKDTLGKDFLEKYNGVELFKEFTPKVAKLPSLMYRPYYNKKAGDVVEVALPMSLKVEECPNYTDYVAFKYGPILLAAKTTAESESESTSTGLKHESLINEYADEEISGISEETLNRVFFKNLMEKEGFRIANIDVSDLSGASAANLVDLMRTAYYKVRRYSGGGKICPRTRRKALCHRKLLRQHRRRPHPA